VDRETVKALCTQLRELGLTEAVPDQPNTERLTDLGRELNIDLMQVFMGFWDPYDAALTLEEYDLISEDEILELEMRLEERLEEEDVVAVLLPLVRRAFFQHFGPGARPN
jgi:hypothetical protein